MSIVDRLRSDGEGERQYEREARIVLGGLLNDAADEIGRLRSALINIRAEYMREGSRPPHLQRVVALQCRAALCHYVQTEEYDQ